MDQVIADAVEPAFGHGVVQVDMDFWRLFHKETDVLLPLVGTELREVWGLRTATGQRCKQNKE